MKGSKNINRQTNRENEKLRTLLIDGTAGLSRGAVQYIFAENIGNKT